MKFTTPRNRNAFAPLGIIGSMELVRSVRLIWSIAQGIRAVCRPLLLSAALTSTGTSAAVSVRGGTSGSTGSVLLAQNTLPMMPLLIPVSAIRVTILWMRMFSNFLINRTTLEVHSQAILLTLILIRDRFLGFLVKSRLLLLAATTIIQMSTFLGLTSTISTTFLPLESEQWFDCIFITNSSPYSITRDKFYPYLNRLISIYLNYISLGHQQVCTQFTGRTM